MASPAAQSATAGIKMPSGLFIVLTCADTAQARHVASAAASLPAAARAMGKAATTARVQTAVGFGAAFWDLISPDRRPAGLQPLPEIRGTVGIAPATGGDVLLHIKSTQPDINLEIGRRVMAAFGGTVQAREEAHGFRYRDWRDLTGFIDGTANPSTAASRAKTVLIGPEDANFAGGSYVLTQRYVHDLARWEKVSVKEQEAIIGRTKRDSREMSRAPESAHRVRAELHIDGVEQPIYRQGLPYGNATGESGVFFCAYARDTKRIVMMLQRIMGAAD